jgi:DNA-binding GntR family transcriptional regulator
MDSPPVDWQLAADDDATPGRPAAAAAAGLQSAAASQQLEGVNPSLQDRGPSRSRQPAEPVAVNGRGAGQAVSVLADRLAAALVHHEPGWRLPRHSALARRYNVSAVEIDAAVDELVGRHLLRRLADGQLYRASPAEYLLGLEGVSGLLSYVDTMGGEFLCRSRQVSWRLPPEDIAWALHLSPEMQVCVVRHLWTAGGEPAALCTAFVPGDIASQPDGASQPNAAGQPDAAGQLGGEPGELPHSLDLLAPEPVAAAVAGAPAALHIELQAPPPSVARSLRLSAGQAAMMVTVRFDRLESGRPVALTVAVLRPDMFRIVIQSPGPPLPESDAGNLAGSWAHVAEDWEP